MLVVWFGLVLVWFWPWVCMYRWSPVMLFRCVEYRKYGWVFVVLDPPSLV